MRSVGNSVPVATPVPFVHSLYGSSAFTAFYNSFLQQRPSVVYGTGTMNRAITVAEMAGSQRRVQENTGPAEFGVGCCRLFSSTYTVAHHRQHTTTDKPEDHAGQVDQSPGRIPTIDKPEDQNS